MTPKLVGYLCEKCQASYPIDKVFSPACPRCGKLMLAEFKEVA